VGQKKHPFAQTLRLTAAAGTNDVEMDPVRPGYIYCLQRVSIINETSAATKVRIIDAGDADELLLEEQNAPQADTVYWISEPIYVTEGNNLLVRWTGCTASDVLKVYVKGWYMKRTGEV